MKRICKLTVCSVLIIAIFASFLVPVSATELKTAIGTIQGVTNGLRVRAKANTGAAVLSTAYENDTVIIIREAGDWYLVNYNLYIGYVHKDYVAVADSAIVFLGRGSVEPYIVNVRSNPTADAEIVDQANMGEKLTILGFENGWYLVKSDKGVGYVRSDLLTLLDKPLNNKGTKAPAYQPKKQTSSAKKNNSSSAAASSTSATDQIVAYAKKYLGYRYVYGGESPSGFDCSGFMYYVYGQFGYKLYRGATSQLQNGRKVSKSELRPGDLVFFGSGSRANHVGMYIGGGNFIHAENSGTGVVISSLVEGYYVGRYLTARRIIG